MKTRKDVEILKATWLADGCWDIEDTEEFEEYHDELLAWRREVDARRAENFARKEEEETQRRLRIVEQIGMPGLLAEIEALRKQVALLEEYLEDQTDFGRWRRDRA